jgi:nitrogenase molybdenum-iron protein NifN
VLTPREALEKFLEVKEKVKNLKVIGIAGPGDALANFENTRKSIEMIKSVDPDITFCLSTNGLMLMYHADEIIRLGVSHVTITINAVDPRIGSKIYREVDFMGVRLKGERAAAILLANQLAGLRYLSSRGIVCKVNIVMIKGINDNHIEDVEKR